MNQHVTEYYWWLIINEVVEEVVETDSDISSEYGEITDDIVF